MGKRDGVYHSPMQNHRKNIGKHTNKIVKLSCIMKYSPFVLIFLIIREMKHTNSKKQFLKRKRLKVVKYHHTFQH